MRFRTSLVLLVLVGISGGYAWLFEIRRPPQPLKDRSAFTVRADEVSRLTIRHGSLKMAFERSERGWRMTEPLRAQANGLALNDLLGDLERLEIADLLADKSPGPAFGLSPPGAVLQFTRRSGATEGLLVGDDTADGQTSFASRSGRHEVLLIPKGFPGRLRKGLNDFRDRSLLWIPKERVVRLSLVYPDRRVTVERKGTGWRVEEPLKALAGADEVDRAIDTYGQIVVDSFLSDDVKDFAPYGLDKPRLEVRLWERLQGEPSGFAIGAKARERQPFETMDTFYARPLGTPSVMTVRVPRPDDCVKEVRHFRPRRLLHPPWDGPRGIEIDGPGGGLLAERNDTGWAARNPHPGALDTERFNERIGTPLRLLEASSLEPAEPGRLRRLGFDAPLGRITLTGEGGERRTLTVGSVDPRTREAFVTLEGEDLLFTTGPAAGEILSARFPALRSLQILATSLSTFQGLEWSRPDGSLVFASEGRGNWVQTKPARREGPLPGPSACGKMLSSLSAERWVAAGDLPWRDYGLDPPAAWIRATLAEGNAPPVIRLLELGARDPRCGDVYARLDHADEVVTVPARLLDVVLSDPAQAQP